MKNIIVSDATLRFNSSLSFKDKLNLARELDRAGVDVIEMHEIADKQADVLLIRSLASLIKGAELCVPAGMTVESADLAWEAVKSAARPRLLVSVPVSPAKIEYDCGIKPAKLAELVTALVSHCAATGAKVEFAAMDATRAEPDFLHSIIAAAVDAGASAVTLCDTAGIFLPEEFAAFAASVPVNNALLGVECSDALGMSVSCAFAAVRTGASLIKTSAASSLTSLDTAADVFRTQGDRLALACRLDMTVINSAVRNIGKILTPAKSGAHTAAPAYYAADVSVSLDAASDIAAVSEAVRALGYKLDVDDLGKVYEEVSRIALSKTVGARELDAIIAGTAMQVASAYKLKSYVINSGNVICATASIQLDNNGEERCGLSSGDGPIDAAFKAIEQIIGHHYELDDFQIQSVTEGREAMGSALVKLREGGVLYSGEGLSTDIIGASIRAYLSALNKIVYEQTGGRRI